MDPVVTGRGRTDSGWWSVTTRYVVTAENDDSDPPGTIHFVYGAESNWRFIVQRGGRDYPVTAEGLGFLAAVLRDHGYRVKDRHAPVKAHGLCGALSPGGAMMCVRAAGHTALRERVLHAGRATDGSRRAWWG